MALFTRDPSRKIAKAAKTYAAAKTLVEAIEKGRRDPGPMNGATDHQSFPYVPGQPYNFGPGDTGNPSAGQVVPLSRPFEDYGAVMGPAFPLLPAAIDEVLDSSGRPLPRLYQYRIAENLDLTFQNQPWNVLRSLVETCDLVHRAAEIRIADITRMDISFSLTDEAIDSIMVDQGVTHAKAARIGREKYGEQIAMLENFWENPYPQLHRSYQRVDHRISLESPDLRRDAGLPSLQSRREVHGPGAHRPVDHQSPARQSRRSTASSRPPPSSRSSGAFREESSHQTLKARTTLIVR